MSQLDTFTNMLTGLSRGTFDELMLYRGGSYQDLNTILNGLGGGSGAITALVGAGAAAQRGEHSGLEQPRDHCSCKRAACQLRIDLSMQRRHGTEATAGNGVQISGPGATRAITCTVSPLTLQLDGATQTGATALNFVGNHASFANNVLNICRMAWQDKVVLRYSNAASDKDLEQGSAGQLRWNSADVAMASDLSGKQDSLIAGVGIFLNGSTIGSYTLRWNGSSTPTVPTAIQELHWDNYAVAQNINLTTGN